MQIHELKPKTKRDDKKRVGRGGKRGTYSGKGQKGQKSRSGAGIRSDFRGGDSPIWKTFPKQRGATKKTDIKHRTFRVKRSKPFAINISNIDSIFLDGDVISVETLIEKGFISSKSEKVKILGGGDINKKVSIKGIPTSKSAQDAIVKAGGSIE